MVEHETTPRMSDEVQLHLHEAGETARLRHQPAQVLEEGPRIPSLIGLGQSCLSQHHANSSLAKRGYRIALANLQSRNLQTSSLAFPCQKKLSKQEHAAAQAPHSMLTLGNAPKSPSLAVACVANGCGERPVPWVSFQSMHDPISTLAISAHMEVRQQLFPFCRSVVNFPDGSFISVKCGVRVTGIWGDMVRRWHENLETKRQKPSKSKSEAVR